MKKTLLLFAVVVTVGLLVTFAFAAQKSTTSSTTTSQSERSSSVSSTAPASTSTETTESQYMYKEEGKCPMHAAMAGAMWHRSMVSSDDGGVIVMEGDRLIKYDKNLNKIKEVNIETNTVETERRYSESTARCPYCSRSMARR